MTTSPAAVEPGFELGGSYYPWKISDTGKDLMLIDRFTGMPVDEFFQLLEDEAERGRAPVILSMIATSIRAMHPDWTVERIVRLVMGTPLSEITMIEGEAAEDDAGPPAVPEPEADQPRSSSPADESSPSSTPEEPSTSRPLSVIRH